MVNYSPVVLDRVFGALSHPIRRGILERLARGRASIKDLAAPFRISLPGFLKHVGILEQAGLIETQKEGRVRSCNLTAGPMLSASQWLAYYENFWSGQLGALDHFLEQADEPRSD